MTHINETHAWHTITHMFGTICQHHHFTKYINRHQSFTSHRLNVCSFWFTDTLLMLFCFSLCTKYPSPLPDISDDHMTSSVKHPDDIISSDFDMGTEYASVQGPEQSLSTRETYVQAYLLDVTILEWWTHSSSLPDLLANKNHKFSNEESGQSIYAVTPPVRLT